MELAIITTKHNRIYSYIAYAQHQTLFFCFKLNLICFWCFFFYINLNKLLHIAWHFIVIANTLFRFPQTQRTENCGCSATHTATQRGLTRPIQIAHRHLPAKAQIKLSSSCSDYRVNCENRSDVVVVNIRKPTRLHRFFTRFHKICFNCES